MLDIIKKTEDYEEIPENAISLLRVRTEALIDFCRYLVLLGIMKVNLKISKIQMNGDKIEDHPILNRLIFLRTFLGKLKPISKKIEYQISKLIRLSLKVQINFFNDLKGKLEAREAIREAPSRLRARLGEDDESGSEEDEEELSDDDPLVGEETTAENGKKRLSYMTENRDNHDKKKFDKRSTKEKRDMRFKEYQKSRIFESQIVREMEDELEERPKEMVKF